MTVDNLKNFITFIYLIVVVIVIFLLVTLVNNLNNTGITIDSGIGINKLSNISYSTDGVKYKPLSDTVDFYNLDSDTVYISADIPKTSFNKKSIFLEVYNNKFTLTANDSLLYDYTPIENKHNNYSLSTRHLIPLNDAIFQDSLTNSIILKMSSDINSNLGKVTTFLIDDTETLLNAMVYISYTSYFYIAVAISTFFLLSSSTFIPDKNLKIFFYIGFYILIISIIHHIQYDLYSIINVEYPYAIYYLVCLCLLLLPLTIAKIFYSFKHEAVTDTYINSNGFYKFFYYLFITLIVLFIFSSILDLREFSITISHITLFVILALITFTIFFVELISSTFVYFINKRRFEINDLYVLVVGFFGLSIFILLIDCFNVTANNFSATTSLYSSKYYTYICLVLIILYLAIAINTLYCHVNTKLQLTIHNDIFSKIIKLQLETSKLSNIDNLINHISVRALPDFKNILEQPNRRHNKKFNPFYKNPIDSLSILFIINKQQNSIIDVDTKPYVCFATNRFKNFEGLKYENLGLATKTRRIIELIEQKRPVDTDSEILLYSSESPFEYGIIYVEGIDKIPDIILSNMEAYFNNLLMNIKLSILKSESKLKQQNIIFYLNEISESRSKETGNHIKRVALYSKLIAEKLGLSPADAELIYIASSMHDLGKLYTPYHILHKPGKLTNDEFDIIKKHVIDGYTILSKNDSKLFQTTAQIALLHHEKYNGKGYLGLEGDNIDLFARIVAVADVFDALSNSRSYKKAWDLDQVKNLFLEERGEHFDPHIVDILLNNFDEFIEINKAYNDVQE